MKATPQTRCLHYKNKPYKILGSARHSETLEDLVLYEALYPNNLGQIWVRPRDNFESLLPDGKTERFRLDAEANQSNPVQRQLEAYNRRDIDAFLACYTDDIEALRHADMTVIFSGKEAMRAHYAEMFKNSPNLRSVVTNRIELGSTIIDEEMIDGHPRGNNVRAVAIYRLEDQLIDRIIFA